jgi:capsular exopolysaccharide synthesis family protein
MRLTAAQSTDNVIIFETAQAPSSPIRPRTLVNTVLAAVVGAMLAVGVAFLVEYLDDTIKTSDDVNRILGLSTLGAIVRLDKGEQELVVATRPLSPAAESFHVLCTNIRAHQVDHTTQNYQQRGPFLPAPPEQPLDNSPGFSSTGGNRTILVTSPGSGEGKSIIAANLALALAQTGLSVVALDADLRHSRLIKLFNLNSHEQDNREGATGGLTGILLEGRSNDSLKPVQVKELRVLPGNDLPPNPIQVLGSQRMRKLLIKLADQVDVVLIDSPPLLPVADAAVLAREVDSVLLVLKAGHTQGEAARQAMERLRQVRANLIGVVLNAAPGPQDSYYYLYDEHYENKLNGQKAHPRRQNGRLTRWLFKRRQKAASGD